VCLCVRACVYVGVCICVRAYVHARACISQICAGAIVRELHDAKLKYGFGRFLSHCFRLFNQDNSRA